MFPDPTGGPAPPGPIASRSGGVTGAGAKLDWFHPKRAWHTAQALAVPHFGHVAVTDRRLQLTAVDVDGRVFDALALTRRR